MQQIGVKLAVLYAALDGLVVVLHGRGSLVHDEVGRLEKCEKLVDLGCGEVGYGVKVVCAVAPLRKEAEEALAAVAGPGDYALFGACDGVQRGHAKPRRNVRFGDLAQLDDVFERSQLGRLDLGYIDVPRFDAVGFGEGVCVLGVLLEGLVCAGHNDANGVVAGGLAQYSNECGILAAGVAVDNALCGASREHILYKPHTVAELLRIVSLGKRRVLFVLHIVHVVPPPG